MEDGEIKIKVNDSQSLVMSFADAKTLYKRLHEIFGCNAPKHNPVYFPPHPPSPPPYFHIQLWQEFPYRPAEVWCNTQKETNSHG